MTKLSGSDIIYSSQAQRVILYSIGLFQKEGIRKVTTQEIANGLSMSKKTLYNIFPSKSELIYQCVYFQLTESKANMEHIIQTSQDSIEEMMHIAHSVIAMYSEFNDEFIMELEKFYPKSWSLIKQYKNTFIKKIITDNLARGKEQRLYRPEIKEQIVSGIYIAASNNLMDQEIFTSKEKLVNIFKEFFLYHIHAVSTEIGVKRLEELRFKISL